MTIGQLPNSSILDRLKKHDSLASQDVLSLFEEISKKSEKITPRNIITSPAFWDGVKSIFTFQALFSPEKHYGQVSTTLTYDAWVSTGMYLRQAIIKAMDNHEITAKDLNLTPNEIADLYWDGKKQNYAPSSP